MSFFVPFDLFVPFVFSVGRRQLRRLDHNDIDRTLF